MFRFVKSPKLSDKVAELCIPVSNGGEFLLLTFSPAFGAAGFPDFAILAGV